MKNNNHPLIWVVTLGFLLGLGQQVLSPKMPLGENEGNLVGIEAEVTTTASVEPLNAPLEGISKLSNGKTVIRTKTAYFDNEVTVWLAVDEACKSVGMGDQCRNDLMGIAYTESRSFNYKAVGDGSKSHGAFQIHLGYHPDITVEQATDPYFAAKWTIKRMIAYGYPKQRDYSIMRHNGTPGTDKTLGYLDTVNYYINL